MLKKPTLKRVLLVPLLLVTIAGNCVAASPPQHKNVVILLADDLGWGDVGFHGGTAETPSIDQLAAEGVELKRFYAYPACSPARAAMLTGRFPHRYGIAGPVRPRDVGLPMNERLLPADFQQAGYQTSLIGKWHLGQGNDENAHPTTRGFDHFYGFMDASVDYYEHTSGRGQLDWQRDGLTLQEEGYSTDLLADEAVRQIKARDASKPFCMVVSFNAPHSPFQAPENLIAKYKASLGERDAIYAAMVDSMDQAIGSILQTIDSEQIRDDTVVVFASDNGAARLGTNAPLRGQKRQVYEGGIHVPCVIRSPGELKPGTTSDQLFAIHDLFPTLAAASGVHLASGKPLDGIDLWASLSNDDIDPRTLVIAENNLAIMQGDWKLIQPVGGAAELYKLSADPSETTNLASRQAQTVSSLSAQLAQYQRRVESDQTTAGMFTSFVSDNDPVQGPADPESKTGLTQEGELLAAAKLAGDAIYGMLGDSRVEANGRGIRLASGQDINKDGVSAGQATLSNAQVSRDQRWYRFYITGLAQDNFQVEKDDLYLKVEFMQKSGSDSLDFIKTPIFPQVVRERSDLRDDATNASLGNATWRTYAMDFRTPFAEVDLLELSVGFSSGDGADRRSEFWISEMNVEPIDAPADYQPANPSIREFPQPHPDSLVALGGRWYFDSQEGDKSLPKQFDYTNADQLLYKTDRFEAPFAGNMSSWLRAGYLDFAGDEVTKDQFKPYAVIITVTDEHIVIRSRNLPNHPTATFPDRWRMLDGNPSYIKEQANTHYLPLVPEVNPKAFAMDAKNSNQALPMGPIGVATNGVIFFNPFDHIFETDAVWRLDRCCGHPSPQQQYHYHKYPVCVKTPWSDEGQSHSGVLGFAFDGFPVYGPYESNGLLAKDDTQNPLNDFNLHEDDQRGPHYHVTPGRYPHLIGGYWGQLDEMNRRRRRGNE